jgi:hypothetical protein
LEILQLQSMLRYAAPMIECLRQQEAPVRSALSAPQQFADRILDCDSLPVFFHTVIGCIADKLRCRFGSLFTRSIDSLGCDKLILRETNFPDSRQLEDCGFYEMDEEGLTPWVARTERSLCLQDLGDRQLALAKLRQYDMSLQWKNKIRDSHEHGDLLIVGDTAAGKGALLRFTDFRGRPGQKHFTEEDRQCLEDILRTYIRPKYESLVTAESQHQLAVHSREISALSVWDSVGALQLPQAVRITAKNIFPSTARSHRVCFVNLLEDDKQHFRHFAVDPEWSEKAQEICSLAGTLTEFTLKSKDNTVFLNDLEHATRQGALRLRVPEAVCALAAKIAFAKQDYGAIVVFSDRYDLSAETHGLVLQTLAERAGEILFRQQMRGQRTSAKDLPEIYYAIMEARNSQEPLSSEDLAKSSTIFSVLDVAKQAVWFVQSTLKQEVSIEFCIDKMMRVQAHRSRFIAIITDLLWHACKTTNKIVIGAERTPDWLRIDIRSRARDPRHEQRHHANDWLYASLRQALSRPRRLHFPQLQDLASRYQIDDGRCGEILKADVGSGFTFTLQLPLLPTASGETAITDNGADFAREPIAVDDTSN